MWWLLKSITSTDAAIDSGRLYSSKQLLNCVIMPEMHFSCVWNNMNMNLLSSQYSVFGCITKSSMD